MEVERVVSRLDQSFELGPERQGASVVTPLGTMAILAVARGVNKALAVRSSG